MPGKRTCGRCRWWRPWLRAKPHGYGDCAERTNLMPDKVYPEDRLKHHGSSAAERCPRYEERKAVS